MTSTVKSVFASGRITRPPLGSADYPEPGAHPAAYRPHLWANRERAARVKGGEAAEPPGEDTLDAREHSRQHRAAMGPHRILPCRSR